MTKKGVKQAGVDPLVKGKLVVKLPHERVDGLVASGQAEYFNPGHGRLMKEWVAVGAEAKACWITLAKEASILGREGGGLLSCSASSSWRGWAM